MEDGEVRVLERADPEKQESLQTENEVDPMEGEQTWPTEEELVEAAGELGNFHVSCLVWLGSIRLDGIHLSASEKVQICPYYTLKPNKTYKADDEM